MQVRMWTDFSTYLVKMVFYEVRGERVVYFNLYTSECFSVKPDSGEKIPDEFIMSMPQEVAQRFMKAMSALLDEHGIKDKASERIEGALEATKYHLEDLRSLLKLNDNKESK